VFVELKRSRLSWRRMTGPETPARTKRARRCRWHQEYRISIVGPAFREGERGHRLTRPRGRGTETRASQWPGKATFNPRRAEETQAALEPGAGCQEKAFRVMPRKVQAGLKEGILP